MIALKTDGFLKSWEWKEIFWVYWIFFTIMIGIIIGFLLILLGKIYEKCIDRKENI